MAKSAFEFAVGERFRPDFEALSAIEVQVILSRTAKEENLSQTALAKKIGDAGFRNEKGNRYLPNDVKETLDGLKKKGFAILQEGRGWEVPKRIGNLVMGFAAQSPEHASALQNILEWEYFDHRNAYFRSSFIRRSAAQINGEARADHYTGRAKELEVKIREVERFGLPIPDLNFIVEPLHHDLFLKVPLELRTFVISNALELDLASLTPVDELIAYALSDTDMRRQPEVMRAAAEAQDDAGPSERGGGNRGDPHRRCHRRKRKQHRGPLRSDLGSASLEFCQGNLEEAIAGYGKSLTLWKKSTRETQGLPPGSRRIILPVGSLPTRRLRRFRDGDTGRSLGPGTQGKHQPLLPLLRKQSR